MKELHPSELFDRTRDLVIIKAATIGLLALSITATATAATSPKPRKTWLAGTALGLAVIGCGVKALERDKKDSLQDLRQASNQGWRSLLAQSFLPAAKISATFNPETWQPKLFDWSLFNTKPERFPHIGLVADSGGGKSTTGLWLTTWLDGKHYAILPHKKPGDYPGIASFCGSRNYGKADDPEHDLQEVLENKYPNISVASFVKSLHSEMDKRYKLYEQGIEDYSPINIHWDEYNAFIRKVNDKSIVPLIEDLVAEARKVKIRIIVMVQSALVEDMGLNGSLKKSIKFIQLSDFATDRATKEDKSTKLTQWMERLVERGDNFPVMIDSKPGIVPHKKYWVNSAETTNQLPGNGDGELGVGSKELQLNEFEAAILQFGQSKPNTVIKARDLINNSRLFRGMTPEEVRIILQSVADRGIGQTEGEGNKLGWKYNQSVDSASTDL